MREYRGISQSHAFICSTYMEHACYTWNMYVVVCYMHGVCVSIAQLFWSFLSAV